MEDMELFREAKKIAEPERERIRGLDESSMYSIDSCLSYILDAIDDIEANDNEFLYESAWQVLPEKIEEFYAIKSGAEENLSSEERLSRGLKFLEEHVRETLETDEDDFWTELYFGFYDHFYPEKEGY